MEVYIVIERPVDFNSMTQEIGTIHVTTDAAKAINYYQNGDNPIIVTKEVEESVWDG